MVRMVLWIIWEIEFFRQACRNHYVVVWGSVNNNLQGPWSKISRLQGRKFICKVHKANINLRKALMSTHAHLSTDPGVIAWFSMLAFRVQVGKKMLCFFIFVDWAFTGRICRAIYFKNPLREAAPPWQHRLKGDPPTTPQRGICMEIHMKLSDGQKPLADSNSTLTISRVYYTTAVKCTHAIDFFSRQDLQNFSKKNRQKIFQSGFAMFQSSVIMRLLCITGHFDRHTEKMVVDVRGNH